MSDDVPGGPGWRIRGKALLAAGRCCEAIADFEAAVDLRRDAAPDLLASSQQALDVARARTADGERGR